MGSNFLIANANVTYFAVLSKFQVKIARQGAGFGCILLSLIHILTHDEEPLSGIAVGASADGVRPYLIEVQALVSGAAYGTPQRSTTLLP